MSSLVIQFLIFLFFFFNDTATTEIYTLSLHDALPIAGDRERLRALRRDHLGCGRQILLGRGSEHGLRARARERERDAAADPAARPRDDDDLALELASHAQSSTVVHSYGTTRPQQAAREP